MATNVQRTCSVTGQQFIVNEVEQDLLERIAELNPALGNEPLPLPTVHPLEVLRQIAAYGGLRTLYKSKSDLSGKPQLSRFDPKSGIRICTADEYFDDSFDNIDFGQQYDFSQSFFLQFATLQSTVIYPPLSRKNCEDSDYSNGAEDLSYCYLCFAAFRSQNCMYCFAIDQCVDCVDCVHIAQG